MGRVAARAPSALCASCVGCSSGLQSYALIGDEARVPARPETVPVGSVLPGSINEVLADAARRSPGTKVAPRVVRTERVTWSDGSLGCPEPGVLCTQALVPGYRIRVDSGGGLQDYHADARGSVRWTPSAIFGRACQLSSGSVQRHVTPCGACA